VTTGIAAIKSSSCQHHGYRSPGLPLSGRRSELAPEAKVPKNLQFFFNITAFPGNYRVLSKTSKNLLRMKRVKRSNAYEATMEANIQGVHSQNTSKNVASNMNEKQDTALSKTASVSGQIERLLSMSSPCCHPAISQRVCGGKRRIRQSISRIDCPVKQ
jgi:hypothetical protein